MKLYNEISKYYDILFPLNFDTLNFLNNNLKGKVLDLGCGTGLYAKNLDNKFTSVTAIDIDYNMIQSIKESKNSNVNAICCNIKTIDEVFQNEKFDSIYCIGNTLVHLEDLNSINDLFSKIYNLLTQEGMLIIQIINYDRIIKSSISKLPKIEDKDNELVFERNYEYNKNTNRISFITTLKVSNKELHNQTILIPLMSEELTELLINNGFDVKSKFGNFNEQEFNENSYHLIIKAKKKS